MKHFIALSLLLFSLIPASAKLAKDIFINDNLNIFNTIDKGNRLDMIDYYEYGQAGEGENKYEEEVEIDTLTNQYLSINLSEALHVEYWISDTISNKAVIAINSTYFAPAADGKLEFYTIDSKKIKPSKIIQIPTISDFIVIPKNDRKKAEDIEEMIDMPFISYQIDPDNGNITATQNMEDILSKVEYNKIKKYLIKDIKYKWTGKKYKRIK